MLEPPLSLLEPPLVQLLEALLEELWRCGDPVGGARRMLASSEEGQRVQGLSVLSALPRVALESGAPDAPSEARYTFGGLGAALVRAEMGSPGGLGAALVRAGMGSPGGSGATVREPGVAGRDPGAPLVMPGVGNPGDSQ